MLERIFLKFFPRLEIIPTKKLLIYENFDPIRTSKLIKKIPRDNVFINPIIVGEVPQNKKLIVLDGINRLEALKKLKIPFILTQVVDYFNKKQVRLLANHHFFFSVNRSLVAKFQKIIGENWRQIDSKRAKFKIDKGEIMGYLRINDQIWSFGKHRELKKTVSALNEIVDSYLGRINLCRRSEVDRSFNAPMEIVFRRFHPKEIEKLTDHQQILNSGITRHLVFSYCLRLNLPLNILKSEENLKVKNQKLKRFIFNRIIQREFRYYASPVYLFDEWK